jgi:SRSO17 transposase
MDAKQLTRLRADLAAFLDELMPDRLGNVTRRRWAETYLRGLLLDGHRKSVEPMAQRLRATDGSARDYEQALQQFLNQSPWDDRPVRDRLARRVVAAVGTGGFVVVDDTGFPKQGTHSVGVARQYSGTLGKVGNCQVAVTLQYATAREVFAIDAQLYLPEEWGCDRDRLDAAGVPRDLGYRPKWQIALTLLEQAKANGLSGVVLADSAYGDATEFRQALDEGRWQYCVGISSTLKVVAADHDFGRVPPYGGKGRRPSRPEKVRAGAEAPSVKEWAQARAKDFRRVTWREGSKGKLSSRFAAWRVRPAHRLSAGKEPLAACWLVVEWPAGEAEPTKYFFSNLAADISLLRLVRAAKGRWWIEHSYKEMKDELGLDHFEGRSWRGWQHHVTLVLLAYAFLVLRRRGRRKKRMPTA